jgi:plastocyanin
MAVRAGHAEPTVTGGNARVPPSTGRSGPKIMHKLILIALAVMAATLVAAPALAAGSNSVKVGDSFFRPGKITIGRGTKVTWNWGGVLLHNVTVKSGPVKFHSKTFVTGRFSHTFTRKGKYVIFCTLHPTNMRETIIVK